ncbi:MAG: glucose 1-dehydrogenase [Burkholderiales bacterium]|nr:glucose 1-dehydrogenase [Burkholderiales bacterium]OJX05003.1 MAG: 3-beta hydroxysteroid dehydrogenase [Burkholderiales bacterium 70-64]
MSGQRIKDKVCIVTGAAMGLGEAMVRRLAGEGGKVMLTDLKDAEGQALAEAIRKGGGQARFMHHDVSDEAQWKAVVDATVAAWGRLDVVVNNAGVALNAAPHEQTLEQWRWLMSINLDGVFLGTREAIRAMKVNPAGGPKGGSIINLSSIEGLVGDPMLGAYNASKGGVTIYTKSVALYCACERLGIRVNSVHPGYIWTPMVENHLASLGSVEEGRKVLDSMHPVGHVGEPDDIAWGVVYLASDESKFVTGSSLVIDGGYTAQ